MCPADFVQAFAAHVWWPRSDARMTLPATPLEVCCQGGECNAGAKALLPAMRKSPRLLGGAKPAASRCRDSDQEGLLFGNEIWSSANTALFTRIRRVCKDQCYARTKTALNGSTRGIASLQMDSPGYNFRKKNCLLNTWDQRWGKRGRKKRGPSQ